MRVNRQYILVKIDKEKQKAYQEKIGNIFVPAQYLYMKFYLQYGQVMQVGEKAARQFPHIQVGDTLIFRHAVEHDPWRLLYTEYNPKYPRDYTMQDEFRVVTGDDWGVLGYIKPDGTWMPNEAYLYIQEEVSLVAREHVSTLFTGAYADMWKDTSAIERALEEMKLDMQNIRDTIPGIHDYKKLEETHSYLGKKAQDMERLTKTLHAKKVCKAKVALVGQQTSRELEIKKGTDILIEDYALLYNINVLGNKYFIINKQDVLGVYN